MTIEVTKDNWEDEEDQPVLPVLLVSLNTFLKDDPDAASAAYQDTVGEQLAAVLAADFSRKSDELFRSGMADLAWHSQTDVLEQDQAVLRSRLPTHRFLLLRYPSVVDHVPLETLWDAITRRTAWRAVNTAKVLVQYTNRDVTFKADVCVELEKLAEHAVAATRAGLALVDKRRELVDRVDGLKDRLVELEEDLGEVGADADARKPIAAAMVSTEKEIVKLRLRVREVERDILKDEEAHGEWVSAEQREGLLDEAGPDSVGLPDSILEQTLQLVTDTFPVVLRTVDVLDGKSLFHWRKDVLRNWVSEFGRLPPAARTRPAVDRDIAASVAAERAAAAGLFGPILDEDDEASSALGSAFAGASLRDNRGPEDEEDEEAPRGMFRAAMF